MTAAYSALSDAYKEQFSHLAAIHTARDAYSPYDKIIDPDPETRAALVRVIAGTANAGQNVFVTLSNKAEGSAPLSVIELAQAIRANNQSI